MRTIKKGPCTNTIQEKIKFPIAILYHEKERDETVELTQMEQNIISFYERYEYQFVDKAGGRMVFIDVSGCPFSLDYVFSVAAGAFEPINSLPELVQKKVIAAMAKRDRNKEEQ